MSRGGPLPELTLGAKIEEAKARVQTLSFLLLWLLVQLVVTVTIADNGQGPDERPAMILLRVAVAAAALGVVVGAIALVVAVSRWVRLQRRWNAAIEAERRLIREIEEGRQ